MKPTESLAPPDLARPVPKGLVEAQPLIDDLVDAFAAIKEAGITHTNRIPTGEYGEWLACHLLDLRLRHSKVAKGSDALDERGRRYEVKAKKIKKPGEIPRVTVRRPYEADFLVAIGLASDYSFSSLYLVDLDPFRGEERAFVLTSSTGHHIVRSISSEQVAPAKISQVKKADMAMGRYAASLKNLLDADVVRTEKILAADLGEFYSSAFFDLELRANVNAPGFDARDSNKTRYQVKTRAQTPAADGDFIDCFANYTSFDFKHVVLERKEFDWLIACFLGERFEPIAFLFVPYEEVVGSILARARASGRKPSPRYRWNLKSFQATSTPEVHMFLTEKSRSWEPELRRSTPNLHLLTS